MGSVLTDTHHDFIDEPRERCQQWMGSEQPYDSSQTACIIYILLLKMQYNRQENEKLLKILIIGNSGVGKSCMLMRYVENNFTTAFYNTIGVDFKMKNAQYDGRKVRMQIWDTAGQDRFRTITSTYYKYTGANSRGAHGIMLVYDVTDRDSFECLKFWMQEIEKYAHENVDKIVVANKSDQIEKRRVSYDEGYNFAESYGLQFVEVSAMGSTNIAECFQMMARKILKRLDNVPASKQKSNTKIGQQDAQDNKKQAGCCG